jgi:2-polyprenyl-3-methyl-5-hydroxy-6-metoxy-1,4-benzoquinol methylase
MQQQSSSIDEVRQRYGEWTAMSIHLGGDLYTLRPALDGRLRRILQIACDLAGKPLDQLRVLDLACLEGHYGIELAMNEAEVVGIELREANLAKARYVKDYLRLNRLTLCQDDVRNLSVEKYGQFDLVICSGILYHLDAPDVFHFIRRIFEVCTRLAIFDTQIALRPGETFTFENETYHGLWYTEHDESADRDTRLKDLWASVDNTRSFWFTPASLANYVARVGFSSFYECLNPEHAVPEDRRAYVAIKGKPGIILSSPLTASMGFTPKPERSQLSVVGPNIKHGPMFRVAKRLLPQSIKNMLKPSLRMLRILRSGSTPKFLKKE